MSHEQDCGGRKIYDLVRHFHDEGWTLWTPCYIRRRPDVLDAAGNISYRKLIMPSTRASQTQYLNEQQQSAGRARTKLQDGILHQWRTDRACSTLASPHEMLA